MSPENKTLATVASPFDVQGLSVSTFQLLLLLMCRLLGAFTEFSIESKTWSETTKNELLRQREHLRDCVGFSGSWVISFPIISWISKMWKCVNWLSPRKTRTVPVHCSVLMELPNRRTEPRMVKNFLVVVTMEQVRGPKLTTVRKMKVW